MFASKGTQSIPGGWGKDVPQHASYDEIEDVSEKDLATGVVNEAGEIVNPAGKTVGKITEGKPEELVGDVVTATGSILGKTGDVVGKAVPLEGETSKSDDGDVPKRGGWTILGTVKNISGLVGNVDKTAQTATKPVGNLVGGVGETVGNTAQTVTKPLGGLTKGLGLGGSDEKDSETGESEPVEIKPEDAVSEKAEKTEDTTKDLPIRDASGETEKATETAKETAEEAGDKTPEAPIDLEDKESAPSETQATGKSALPTDTPTTSHDAEGAREDGLKSFDSPEDFEIKDDAGDKAADTLGETKDKTADTTEETKDNADDTLSEAQDKTEEPAADTKEKTEDTLGDTKDKTEDTLDAAKDKTEDTVDDTKDKTEEAVGETEDKVEDTKSQAPEIPEDQKTVTDAKSAVEGEGAEDEEAEPPAPPFERFENPVVGEDGRIIAEDGESIGRVVEGEAADLEGKHVDDEGNIVDEKGDVLGKAELKTELAEEDAANAVDFTVLKDCKANKMGNIVNDKGEVVGRITEGVLKNLVGKKCDEQGQFWNDSGKIIGKAEPIPENERSEFKEPAPFEDFPDATVQSNGDVVSNGEVIGKVTKGDPKTLKGKKVDDDGDILDKNGNVLGHAERWEEPEKEAEPEKDRSILAGKRVNKAGNVVDSNGQVFGRVIEGDPKRLAGRMCDKDGNIRSESGDILGKAEVVPEGEREGFKDGPFAELQGCTVAKDGKVVTPAGDVVGRLIKGDGKVLFGRAVDEDGDVLDRNGNSIGKAERWEEPEVEKKKGPMAGRKVNREGNVVDEDGNLIGKLTTGELSICSGKEIDDDGDVVDSKGRTIGHVSLLSEIPPEPAPTESEEDKTKREQAEEDKKLAQKMSVAVEQCLDKIRPICKMITQKIEKAERTPKEELDEEDLVKQVKPLIEEGGRILNESNGAIRGLDPDGRIQAKAKHNSATREATPEEYHLADVLKELTGTVTECIEGAKRKIEDMPHAKKELNPLWGLLTEPLFQILAAVGLLLNGVLALVGRLLSGLGLGGLIDNLLGGLGLTRLLDSLGVGSLTKALTGKDKKKK